DLVVLREKDSNGNSLVFGTGTNRYWKVYLNTSTVSGTTQFAEAPFALYPNPVTSQFLLTGLPALSAQYTILDNLGRTLQSGNFLPTSEPKVNVHGLPSGLYLLQVNQAGSSRTLRFVKE
ncbi:T9SS type A sorting domain-containing protein, partial [Hymenobacter sp. ASUV-10]